MTAILDATAHILVSRGTAQLTTNWIAERAGVSIGSLYQYFPNKQAILAALHRRHDERMLAAALQAFAPDFAPSFDEGMSRIVRGIAQAHLVEPELHQLLLPHPAHPSDAPDSVITTVRARLTQAFEVHQECLPIRQPAQAASALTHAVHSLVHAVVFHLPKGTETEQGIEELVRLARGYVHQPGLR